MICKEKNVVRLKKLLKNLSHSFFYKIVNLGKNLKAWPVACFHNLRTRQITSV